MKARSRYLHEALTIIVLVSLLSFSSLLTAASSYAQADCKEAKIGVLIVHGMGEQEPSFADAFIKKLKRRISVPGSKKTDICWQPVYWANVLSGDEATLWKDVSSNNDLHWPETRKYVINSIGDALAYQEIAGEPDCTYNLIHKSVHDSIHELRKRLGDRDQPIIVMAHSMGSVIMSDYILDRQNPDCRKEGKDPYGTTALECMETLSGFITFGSPIALYTLAYNPEDVECITFPPETLSGELGKNAMWLNFYNPADVLGWPLKTLKDTCYSHIKKMVDRPVKVGGPLTSWNPRSHTEYWTGNSFIIPAAEYISRILKICKEDRDKCQSVKPVAK